ncbi:hypothetical protein [Marivirga sp.]|uniref:hypothetical protein n=1 Tax=Marivirga sp. TaxID=2018662 RepID=UPI003DA70BA1
MDKQRLTTLINQPEKLEENDFRDLNDLKKEFPYFQALSPLITLGSKKYSPESEKKCLQTSAIYALDRKHLKEILTQDYQSNVTESKESPQKESTIPQEKNKVVEAPFEGYKTKSTVETDSTSDLKTKPISETSHLPDSFFEELFKDMEALKEEKENYQKTLEKFEAKKPTSKPKTATNKKTTKKPASSKTSTTKKVASKKTTAKSTAKKTSTAKTASRTKASPKKASPAKTSSKKSTAAKKTDTTKSTSKKPKKDEHDIIEEITSRKELKISDAHKKEQLDIINNFIQKEPVLTKRIDPDNQSNKQEAEDLSANSTNLSDDVVSETLAKLMIKQGRKQKAIDIYKKLIWKFPQKKTYFVEIIDELKKES